MTDSWLATVAERSSKLKLPVLAAIPTLKDPGETDRYELQL